MWIYEKKLQFPVKITRPDARMAKIMIEQYGGCDGEWGAAHRYLSQRYSMVTPEAKATLNDIATEELGHAEIMGTIVRQLMQGLTKDQIIEGGLEAYYVNHGFGVYPCSAAGVPFSAAAFQSKGDPITDLYEDMAAEQKARSTYEYLIDLAEDPDVLAPLRFLREREVVHFQRFGEANREDCSKIPKARKTHKFSTFGKSLSIRTFAGHRHKPPYLLLYLKMKIIHEIGQAAFSYN